MPPEPLFQNPPKRILLIPQRFIGDAVLTLSIIRCLKASFPSAQIHVLIPKSLVNLMEASPDIDDVLILQKRFYDNYKMLVSRQYDVALLMRRSVSQAFLLKLAGVNRIIGFRQQRFPKPLNYQPWALFLDDAVDYPRYDDTQHHLQSISAILHPLGIQTENAASLEKLALNITDEDKALAQFILNKHQLQNQKIAVLVCQSASKEKALDVAQFVPSVQLLAQRGFQLLALGTEADKAFYRKLSEASRTAILNLCGETTLRQSAALYAHAQLLFGLDSGPMHMAAAMGTPNLAIIYGPIQEQQWRPWPYDGNVTAIYHDGLTCRPCEAKVCEHNRCRTDLSGDAIAQKLQQHLDRYLS